MTTIRLASTTAALLIGSMLSPCFASDKGVHGEIVVTGAYTVLKGRATTYNFISASPELRVRYGQAEGGGWFGAIGTPLANNLNDDPKKIQGTEPVSIFNSNVYVAAGYAFPLTPGGPSANIKVPITISVGGGIMNQQINSTTKTYDKGAFIYIGVTAALVGF